LQRVSIFRGKCCSTCSRITHYISFRDITFEIKECITTIIISSYCIGSYRSYFITILLYLQSGNRKPLLSRLYSDPMKSTCIVAIRLYGKGWTNVVNTNINHLSRIKSVSGNRNVGFHVIGLGFPQTRIFKI